jgi:hypothetical protein
MQFQPTDRFSIAANVLSQEVGGETVLLDLAGESYFSLNEVGTRIWQMLAEGSALADLLDALADEYDVARGQLESEVGDLLAKLADAGLVSQEHD